MQNLEWTRMLAWLEAYRGRTTGRRIGLCEAANGIDAGENNVNGVKPHEICILHLSDLHFEKDKHKSVYREMIDDIRKQVEKVRRLVLVVTGDFAMAGRVGEVADKVIVFFEKLKTVIPPECELMDVELVPGNHDIRRPLKKYAFNANTYIGDQGEYLKLEKKIYSLFECTKNRDPESHVSVIEYLGQKIVFARLDTSSLESAKNLKNQVYSDVLGRNETPLLTEDEIKNLSADTKREADRIIERRKKAFEHEFELQRKLISGQYAEKIDYGKKPALTIAIAHHPLSWLRNTGYDNMYDVLFKNGLSYVDIWMCGHMHNVQTYYVSENNRHKIMLMSGIGRQETQTTMMRYSIYRISLERNTCLVNIRCAEEGVPFSDDSMKGFDEEIQEYGGITFPVKADSIGSVIHAKAIESIPCRGLYVDKRTLCSIPKIAVEIQRLRDYLKDKMLGYECIFMAEQCSSLDVNPMLKWHARSPGEKGSADVAKIKRKFAKFCSKRKLFVDFLKTLNNSLVSALSSMATLSELGDGCGQAVWRVHTRVYDGVMSDEYLAQKDTYRSLAARVSGGQEKDRGIVRSAEWDSYIRSASECKMRVVIESSAPGESKMTTKWSDFMTLIPAFKGSVLELRRHDGSLEKRPILTMGISFKGETFEVLSAASRLEYSLVYLDINRTIGECIDQFIRRFSLDINYLRKELSK